MVAVNHTYAVRATLMGPDAKIRKRPGTARPPFHHTGSAQRAGATVPAGAFSIGTVAVPVVAPGAIVEPVLPGAIVAEPVERSMLFSLLLFTLAGLFMFPSALPPPAGV